MLAAALAEATLVPRLAINNGHDTDAVNTTVIDAWIIVLLAAAVAVRFARSPARAVNTRLALVAATAGVPRGHSLRDNHAGEGRNRDTQRPSGHSASERYGNAVKVIRIHADNSA